MAAKPLQFWYNKAEDFSSSAFVLLRKVSKTSTDVVIINKNNNTLSAFANFEENPSDEELKEALKPIEVGDNFTFIRLEDHHKTVILPKSLYVKGEEEKIFGFNFSQTEGKVSVKEIFNTAHILLFEEQEHKTGISGHILEGILEYVNTFPEQEMTLVYVSYAYFVIIRKSGNALTFVNAFEYQTSEDFIYYLLFTLEQLEFDNEKETLHYFGEFEVESALHKLIKQYFKNENVLNTTKGLITFPEDIPQNNKHRQLAEAMYLLCV